MDADKRPTAGQLAHQARPGGLECPKCGCRHFWTRKTRPADGIIQRRRESAGPTGRDVPLVP